MTTLTERDFQRMLIDVVRTVGGMVYHAHDSRREVMREGRRQLVGDADAKGYPDLTIVTRHHRAIWAELKSATGRLTDSQRTWLRALPKHCAYLWRPDDLDAAVRIIQSGHRIDTNYEATCIACNVLPSGKDRRR